MVRVIPFRTFLKLWVTSTDWGDTFFAFCSVFSVNLGKFPTIYFYCKVKFSHVFTGYNLTCIIYTSVNKTINGDNKRANRRLYVCLARHR